HSRAARRRAHPRGAAGDAARDGRGAGASRELCACDGHGRARRAGSGTAGPRIRRRREQARVAGPERSAATYAGPFREANKSSLAYASRAMNTSADPREILKNAPMSALQIFVVVVTIALNALDGFDVMSISFASPGIATEWGINRAALGIVLSMELIGMAIGSILLGGVADKIGRRPTMLGCLAIMAVGMFMVTTSNGVLGSILAPVIALFGQTVDVKLADLSGWRVVTGLGIGGMLAAINAVASEFSNEKSRHLNVSLMSIGYPIGAVLGGLVAAQLLKSG